MWSQKSKKGETKGREVTLQKDKNFIISSLPILFGQKQKSTFNTQ
jgi:hypothetical protein